MFGPLSTFLSSGSLSFAQPQFTSSHHQSIHIFGNFWYVYTNISIIVIINTIVIELTLSSLHIHIGLVNLLLPLFSRSPFSAWPTSSPLLSISTFYSLTSIDVLDKKEQVKEKSVNNKNLNPNIINQNFDTQCTLTSNKVKSSEKRPSSTFRV